VGDPWLFFTLTFCHILHSVSHWPVLVYYFYTAAPAVTTIYCILYCHDHVVCLNQLLSSHQARCTDMCIFTCRTYASWQSLQR
jgi:hypothetical protein